MVTNCVFVGPVSFFSFHAFVCTSSCLFGASFAVNCTIIYACLMSEQWQFIGIMFQLVVGRFVKSVTVFGYWTLNIAMSGSISVFFCSCSYSWVMLICWTSCTHSLPVPAHMSGIDKKWSSFRAYSTSPTFGGNSFSSNSRCLNTQVCYYKTAKDGCFKELFRQLFHGLLFSVTWGLFIYKSNCPNKSSVIIDQFIRSIGGTRCATATFLFRCFQFVMCGMVHISA